MKLASKLMTIVAFVAIFSLPSFAHAQKIATANMQRILTEIKEFKELETKLRGRFEEAKRQQETLQGRARELQGQRDQFKPGSPEYDRANNDLIKLAVEAQVAGQVVQQELVREQKRQLRGLSDKIVAQVKVVAESKQITLVISQVLPQEISDENWEKLTPEQASQLLSQRNLLYVAPDMDITNEVITSLDAAHASGK
jgi:Skp family chaperone for outer membrane proteins